MWYRLLVVAPRRFATVGSRSVRWYSHSDKGMTSLRVPALPLFRTSRLLPQAPWLAPSLRSVATNMHAYEEFGKHGFTDSQTLHMIDKCPELATLSAADISDRMQFLKNQINIPAENVSDLLYLKPEVIGPEYEAVKEILLYLQDIGVQRFDVLLKRSPRVIDLSINEHVRPMVEYFGQLGVSTHEFAHAVTRLPRILIRGLDADVQQKMDYLLELGIDKSNLGKVMMRNPGFLFLSLEDVLKPRVAYLRQLGVGNIAKAIERLPSIFNLSFEKNLKSKVELLLSLGIRPQDIWKIAERYPGMWSITPQNIRLKVDWLRMQGIAASDVGSILTRCPSIMGLSIPDTLDARVRWLLSVGIEKAQIGSILTRCPHVCTISVIPTLFSRLTLLENSGISNIPQLIARFPTVLALSDDNLQQTMAFLVDLVGKENLNVMIHRNPSLLGRSITGHLKDIVAFLGAEGWSAEQISLIVKRRPSLLSMKLTTLEERCARGKQLAGSVDVFREAAVICPTVLTLPEESLHQKLQCLGDMGYAPEVAWKWPIYFAYSLAQRVVPRWAFYSRHAVDHKRQRTPTLNALLSGSDLSFATSVCGKSLDDYLAFKSLHNTDHSILWQTQSSRYGRKSEGSSLPL